MEQDLEKYLRSYFNYYTVLWNENVTFVTFIAPKYFIQLCSYIIYRYILLHNLKTPRHDENLRIFTIGHERRPATYTQK